MDYEGARTALGLNLIQFCEVLELPLGIYGGILEGELEMTRVRHLYLLALLEGFRPPNWPVKEEARNPEQRLYMVEIVSPGTKQVRWVPTRARDNSQAMINAAIMHDIHISRIMTVKEMA